MIDHHSLFLLLSALVAVLGLIFLVAVVKLNPVVTLLVTSLGLAVAVGMPLTTALHSFETGLGGILGHIAVIIALGTMLGKMMAESGAADRIADTLVRFFGEKNVPWAMVLLGLLIGLPAFFEVGFVLLVPVAFTVAQRTKTSMVLVGLPMAAGLSVVHGLVPPHPAAMLAVTIYKADVGRTILYALIIGIPTAIISGPIYAWLIAPHVHISSENPMATQLSGHSETRKIPGFWISVLTILLPVILMMIGTLMSFITLGTMRGFSRDTILRFSNECLAPTATITLLVGAGGGFGRVLQDCGVSAAIVTVALRSHVSLLVLAWLLAALLRLATGSATVAMSAAASIVAPIALHTAGVHPELLAIATGAGSLLFSHVNDGGFWLVKEYFNMSVGETMKTWSIAETLISVVGFGLTAVAWYLV